jgi:hypothetical protein
MKEVITRSSTKTEEVIDYPEILGLYCIRTSVCNSDNKTIVTSQYRVRDNAQVFRDGKQIFVGYVCTPFLCITNDGKHLVCTTGDKFVPLEEYDAKNDRAVMLPEDNAALVNEFAEDICRILNYLATHDGFCATIDDCTIVAVDKCIWKAGCTGVWHILLDCEAIDSNGIFASSYDKSKLKKNLGDCDLDDIENVLEELQDLVQE